MKKIRDYLLKHTPPTLTEIPDGVEGQFCKINEEFLELKDAIAQRNRPLTFIEACDVIDSTAKFQFKQFTVPLPAVVALIYLRRVYKPFRNMLYRSVGLSKSDFNGVKNG